MNRVAWKYGKNKNGRPPPSRATVGRRSCLEKACMWAVVLHRAGSWEVDGERDPHPEGEACRH